MTLIRLTLMPLCLLLTACNPLMKASWDTLKSATQGPAPLELSREQVEAVPYYQITVAAPTGEAVLALVRQQGDVSFWLASTQQVLLLQDGLAIRSVGFNDNLDGTRFIGESPFRVGLHRIPDGLRSERELDFATRYQMGVRLVSEFERVGLERVTILDRELELLRVDEHVEAPGLGFSTVNHYWVDPADGFILMSLQHVTPDLPLRIVQVKPLRPGNQAQ